MSDVQLEDAGLITKSQRHTKIIGLYGELVVSNLLSRKGFEVLPVDHVSIDVIASHRQVGRIGVTVKSRTRQDGHREGTSVNLFRQNGRDEVAKLQEICKTFDVNPWLAVYVETKTNAYLYMTSLSHYMDKLKSERATAIYGFNMSAAARAKYDSDPEVMKCRFDLHFTNWWPNATTAVESPTSDADDRVL